MGKRHTGRKLAFQALYQMQIRPQDVEEILQSFLEESDKHEDTKAWALELAKGAWEHHDAADKFIIKYAKDWDFDRINPIDKSLLRVAFFELIQTKTPPNVVVDEALELAKEFSTEDSPKFINGILGHYIEDYVHRNNKSSR